MQGEVLTKPQAPQGTATPFPIFKVFADGGKHPPVALDRPVCIIGRSGIANLPLRAPAVSKAHAIVVRHRGGVYLRDLASTNGVQRNGSPVDEAALADEDVIRIGSYTLRCAAGFGPRVNGDTESHDVADVDAPGAELRGADKTYPFPRERRTLLIGRRAGCDLRLDDPSVEAVHAIVFWLDGRRYVHDLGTGTGTFVNGRSAHREPLNPGDELRIGKVRLRYALVDEIDAAEAGIETDDAEAEIESEIELEPALDASGDASESGGSLIQPVLDSGIGSLSGMDVQPLREPAIGAAARSTSATEEELEPIGAIPMEVEPEDAEMPAEPAAERVDYSTDATQEELEPLTEIPIEPEPERERGSAPEPAAVAEPEEAVEVELVAPPQPEPELVDEEPPTAPPAPAPAAPLASAVDDELSDIPPIDLALDEPEPPPLDFTPPDESALGVMDWSVPAPTDATEAESVATPPEEALQPEQDEPREEELKPMEAEAEAAPMREIEEEQEIADVAETAPAESAADDAITEAAIAAMVDELTEKAEVLKAAWAKYRSKR